MSDISLEDETLRIYAEEIEKLIQSDSKFKDLSHNSSEVIIKAFEFMMEHGKEKVRAQMLYDMISKGVDTGDESE